MDINIRHDEHIFIAGQTGTGKTTLAKALLRARKFVVVLDPKNTFRDAAFGGTIVRRLKDLPNCPNPHIIYRPSVRNGERTKENLDAFFWWIYDRRNTTVYVDEAALISKDGNMPDGYLACLVEGRELGISVISASQRPKNIHNSIISESSHYFIFRLNLKTDREKVGDIIGDDVIKFYKPRKYFFWYFAPADMEEPTLCTPIAI